MKLCIVTTLGYSYKMYAERDEMWYGARYKLYSLTSVYKRKQVGWCYISELEFIKE